MIPRPRPELVLIAGEGGPPAAEATGAEKRRLGKFRQHHPDSAVFPCEGAWFGNVRVPGRDGKRRNECTAVRDTLGEVLDVLEEWAAELGQDP